MPHHREIIGTGKNQDIRKKIAGHERNIWKHHLKIEDELRKDFPSEDLLAKWRRDIGKAEAAIAALSLRLERRRKNAAHKEG